METFRRIIEMRGTHRNFVQIYFAGIVHYRPPHSLAEMSSKPYHQPENGNPADRICFHILTGAQACLAALYGSIAIGNSNDVERVSL
jgi:hypothetical protein